MPSYRVTVTVGRLAVGTAPDALLPAAAAAASALTTVEARDVEVVRGEARLLVRYEGVEDGEAFRTADAVVAEVRQLAEVVTAKLNRRDGQIWTRLQW